MEETETMESVQPTLTGMPEPPSWKDEWDNMPEYISENKKPIQQITVSFANYEDVKRFAELMGMKVSERTDSTWYPHRPHTKYTVGYRSEK